MTPQEQEDEKVRADMQKFGRFCDSQLPYGWGFIFLAFPYGQGGRMNYVSTADRADVVRAMYEFIDKTKESWVRHEPELDSAAEDEQLARARQRVAELDREREEMLGFCTRQQERIAALEHQHEEMLLKHAKDQHTALELLDNALKEIERLNKINEEKK